MKARAGFVSNSSSLSFLVDTAVFATVRDVALAMVNLRTSYTKRLNRSLTNKLTKSKRDPNHPIAFNSCNDDTYIVNTGALHAVATCRNHEFHMLDGIKNISDCADKGVIETLGLDKLDIGEMDSWHDVLVEYVPLAADFWWPEYNLVLRDVKIGERALCTEHYQYTKVIVEGKDAGREVCPVCYKK